VFVIIQTLPDSNLDEIFYTVVGSHETIKTATYDKNRGELLLKIQVSEL